MRFGTIIGRALQAEKRITSGDALRFAAILTLALVVIAGAAQWVVNDEVTTLWDGVWWAVVTATTVGYGDITPRGAEGRIIAILVMAVGVAFVSLLTAAIAARFVRTDEAGTDELRDALARIEADLAEIKARLG
jgi:voltage-gated potassium channel